MLEDRSNCMFIGNFRLEMTSGGSLHNYLLKAASLRRPHHVAQGFFKSGIEYLQGGNISQSLGSLCHSGLSSDEKKIVLLYVQSESVLFQHLPTASSLLLKVWPCLPNVQGYRQEMANVNFHQSPSSPGRMGSNPCRAGGLVPSASWWASAGLP